MTTLEPREESRTTGVPGRIAATLFGVAAILAALALGLLALAAGSGAFENSEYSETRSAIFGGATTVCTFAAGVFSLAYAATGESRLVVPHLALWAMGAVAFFALLMLLG